MLDESHDYLESGFMQVKEILYGSSPIRDDEFIVQMNNCSSEDIVSISKHLLWPIKATFNWYYDS